MATITENDSSSNNIDAADIEKKKNNINNAINELQKLMNVAEEDEDEDESAFVVEGDTDSEAEKEVKKEKEKTKQRKPRGKKILKPQSVQKKQRFKKDGTPYKKRKFRPGTVALRHIKEYQRSYKLLTPKTLMKRTIMRHVNNHAFSVRLAKGCVECVQEIIEHEIVEMTKCCQLIRLNCNQQVTLTGDDALLYQKIRFKHQF